MPIDLKFAPDVEAAIKQAEAAHPSIADGFLRAAIWQESRGRFTATSNKGAQGIAQVIPTTAANPVQGLGIDIPALKNPRDVNESVSFIANALDALVTKTGSRSSALATYNAGPRHNPNNLPAETRGYINSITGLTPKFASQATQPAPDSDWQSMLKAAAGKLPDTTNLSPEDALMTKWDNDAAQSRKAFEAKLSAVPLTGVPVPTQSGKRSFRGQVADVGLTTAGAVAGGLAGAATPIPGGAYLGSIAGAGLGQGLANWIAPPEQPSMEILKSAGTQAILGPVGSLIGKALTAPVMREGGQALLNFMAQRAGGKLPLAAQVFDNHLLNLGQTVGKASFFTGKTLQEAEAIGVNATRESAMNYANAIAANKDAGWSVMEYAISRANAAQMRIATEPVANAAEVLAKSYPGNEVLKALDVQLKNAPPSLPFFVSLDTQIANNAAARAAAAQGVQGAPEVLGAQNIASKLKDAMRGAEGIEKVEIGKVLERVMAGMDAKLAAQPHLREIWQSGRNIYRSGVQGDEMVTLLNLSLPPGAEAGEISGKLLMNKLKPEALKNLGTSLEPGQIENLRNIALALKAAEGPTSGALSFISNGVQISALIRVGTKAMEIGAGGTAAGLTAIGVGGIPAGGAMLLALTPTAIAKIVGSPKLTRMMLALTRLPAGTPAAARVTTEFIAQLSKENIAAFAPTEQVQSQGQ